MPEDNAKKEEITVNGIKTVINLKSLTAEQLETMSDEQLEEAKAELEKFKQEFCDVKNVFAAYYQARAKTEMARIKSLFEDYLAPIAKWCIGLAVAGRIFNLI